MNQHSLISRRVSFGALLLAAALAGASFAHAQDKTESAEREPKTESEPHEAKRHDTDKKLDHHHGGRRGKGLSGGDEMMVLDRLLSMPTEKIARVRQAVERIEAMSPEEREALRERLRDFREISPEKRKEMREKWSAMSPDERREYIREMRERRWDELLEDGP